MMRAQLPEQKQIQAATPAARRRTLMFLVVTAITGLALLIGVEEWLATVRDRAFQNPQQASDEIAYVIHVLAAAISLSLFGLALVVARVSWRVYAARRFPPPGMRLAFDVAVVEDLRAVWAALGGLAIASVLAALAVVTPYLLWRILSLIVPAHAG